MSDEEKFRVTCMDILRSVEQKVSSIDNRLSKLKSRNETCVNCGTSAELLNKYREFTAAIMMSTQQMKPDKEHNVEAVAPDQGDAVGQVDIAGEEAEGELNPFNCLDFDFLGDVPFAKMNLGGDDNDIVNGLSKNLTQVCIMKFVE